MRTAQYVRQERAIAAADAGGIRERWLYGLRILRDPDAMAESGKSLRHGVAQALISAARLAGRDLTDREIRYRIACARAYPKESQIGTASSDFDTWTALRDAGFPPIDAPGDEPLADHRTTGEKRRDAAHALAERAEHQDALFPLDQFEPTQTTLKELVDYADRQDEITERFMAYGRKRRAYLDQLIEVAAGDLSWTWQQAQVLLPDDEEIGA